MIDIENEIYTAVRNAVLAAFPSGSVSGDYEPSPSAFPHLTVECTDNSVYERLETSLEMENASLMEITINGYSNKQNGKKTECKNLMETADTVMKSYGFRRLALRPTPNLADASIYRMTATYTAVVSKDKIIYRR
jgi:hypothetical protein